jgi:hypothetical protein
LSNVKQSAASPSPDPARASLQSQEASQHDGQDNKTNATTGKADATAKTKVTKTSEE